MKNEPQNTGRPAASATGRTAMPPVVGRAHWYCKQLATERVKDMIAKADDRRRAQPPSEGGTP
jgi:hypothetical protein